MNLDQLNDVPDIVMEFLEYHSTVRGHSDRTIAGYYLDLKILFRYLKRRRRLVPKETPFQEIDITDIDLDFIKSIRIEELYRYQSFSPEYENGGHCHRSHLRHRPYREPAYRPEPPGYHRPDHFRRVCRFCAGCPFPQGKEPGALYCFSQCVQCAFCCFKRRSALQSPWRSGSYHSDHDCCQRCCAGRLFCLELETPGRIISSLRFTTRSDILTAFGQKATGIKEQVE